MVFKSLDPMYRLCSIFVVIASDVSAWLDYGMKVLVSVLQWEALTYFELHWPTVQYMQPPSNLLSRNRQYGPLIHAFLHRWMWAHAMPILLWIWRSDCILERFTQAYEVSTCFLEIFGRIDTFRNQISWKLARFKLLTRTRSRYLTLAIGESIRSEAQ